MTIDREPLVEGIAQAAIAAGEAIMQVYARDFTVTVKRDASPLTEADHAAEAILLAALARLAPAIPVVAEEEAAAGRVPEVADCFFLVDPLDGTREFVDRNGDFTVNVALIEDHAPALGVVYAPVERQLWVGVVGEGAWSADVDVGGAIGVRMPLAVAPPPADAISVVASRSHGTAATEAYLAQFRIGARRSRGSSLKLCLVAAGDADLYPRLGPTAEWDIAAGDAVLRAAGGRLLAPDGAPMRYGKPGFLNRGFVACGQLTPPPLAPFLDSSAGPNSAR